MSIVQGTGETFSPLKRTSSTSKLKISSVFSLFVGHFCPSETGSGSSRPKSIRIRNNNAATLSRLRLSKCCVSSVEVDTSSSSLGRSSSIGFHFSLSDILRPTLELLRRNGWEGCTHTAQVSTASCDQTKNNTLNKKKLNKGHTPPTLPVHCYARRLIFNFFYLLRL